MSRFRTIYFTFDLHSNLIDFKQYFLFWQLLQNYFNIKRMLSIKCFELRYISKIKKLTIFELIYYCDIVFLY